MRGSLKSPTDRTLARVVVVTLAAREDRRRRVVTILEPHREVFQKLQWWPAVCGRKLACERLVPSWLSNSHSADFASPRFELLKDSRICWNYDWLHMTPGAVGCALSHRSVWESMVRETEDDADCWLVLEDDLLWVVPDLDVRLAQVFEELPSGWHLCYVGWHGQSALQLSLGDSSLLHNPVSLEEVTGAEPLGTFAYLISRSGARRLLEPNVIFPLERQLDAQLSKLQASFATRLCAFRCLDRNCLFYSPPCQLLDSDVPLGSTG